MTGQVTLTELLAIASSREADDVRTTATAHHFEDVLADAVHGHARFVFKVAYSVLHNREDAEDAVQETFLRAMRHAHEFSKVGNRRAWLARTAWRIAIDRTRKVRHASLDDANEGLLPALGSMDTADCSCRSGNLPWVPPPSPSGEGAHCGTEALLINRQMLGLLRSFIAALPADLRDVVTLSTVNEMTSAEMAAVLGIPENSVRTRLFRARQLLKGKFTAVLERGSRPPGAV